MRELRLVHSRAWCAHPSTVSPDADDRAEAAGGPSLLEPGAAAMEHLPPLNPQVRSILEHVRFVVPVPNVVRVRALARARAAIAALRC